MADTDLVIRTRVDTAGIREGLLEAQREADANPLRVGSTAGTFAGESIGRSPLAPGIVSIAPAGSSRLPSESIPLIQAAPAPYLVGPAGWRGGYGGNGPPPGTVAAGASPDPYGVGPGGFPSGSVPIWNRPAAGTIGPAPYATASTLPEWTESARMGVPEPDMGDVEALGVPYAAPAAVAARRRGWGLGGRGYGGLLAIHFATHITSGIAQYSLRSQQTQAQLARGEDPELDALRAEQENIQNLESIPFIGQGAIIGEAITSRIDPGGYSKLNIQGRMQDIERGRREAGFETSLGAERLETRMATDNLRRQAWQEGLTGTAEQRGAAQSALAEAQDRAYVTRSGLVAARNLATGKAWNDADERLQEFDRDRPSEATAEVALRDARLRTVARGERRRGSAIINRAGGLILGAAGFFGQEAEEDFEASLRQREDDASADDPTNLPIVRAENELRRQERSARRSAARAATRAGTERLAAVLARNPLGVIAADLAEGERAAEQEGADPQDVQERLARARTRAAVSRQELEDTRTQIGGSLAVQAAALRIGLDPSLSPGIAAGMTQSADIYGGTLLKALGLAQRGFGEEAQQAIGVGQLQLQRYALDYQRGFRLADVDPSRQSLTGGNTEDSGKVLADIATDIKKLQDISSDVGVIRKAIEDLGKTQE